MDRERDISMSHRGRYVLNYYVMMTLWPFILTQFGRIGRYLPRIWATPLSVIGTVRKQMLKTFCFSLGLSIWIHLAPLAVWVISVKSSLRSSTVDVLTSSNPFGIWHANRVRILANRLPAFNILKQNDLILSWTWSEDLKDWAGKTLRNGKRCYYVIVT